MKLIFIALIAVAVSVSPVCGQSSPVRAIPPKTSAAAPSTLTKEERDHAIDYLKETQKYFLAATEGLSDAQWKFKAAPDRWSIAEVAEHIAVTEGTIWKSVSEMMKSPATPEKAAEANGKDEIILTKVPDRTRKAQAPEQLKPTGRWATRAALVKDYEDNRSQEIAFLKDTKEDLRNHFGEHPFLKTIDAYQWLLLNGAHCKRHTSQILEVKADPNYPKS
jgi:hypothetical protein